MPVTDYARVHVLQATQPNTTAALTWLVPAMETLAREWGKRSLFGRDKGVKAARKYDEALVKTLYAMTADGLVHRSDEPETFRTCLIQAMRQFTLAYPNWQDAYTFFETIFVEQADFGRDSINRVIQYF